MVRDAEKDKFIEEYWEGRRKLPDDDFAITKYNASHDSKIKKLFGGWMSFSDYQRKYPLGNQIDEIPNAQEQTKTNPSEILKGIEKNIANQETMQKRDLGRITEIPSIKKTLRDAGFEYPSKKSDKESD